MFEPIPLTEFCERILADPMRVVCRPEQAQCIVSLRDLVHIDVVQPMHRDYLTRLMRSVTLTGDMTCRIYAKSAITTVRIDPSSVSLGQTFVERAKYQRFFEQFESLFRSFCVPQGMAKLGACIVYGRTVQGVCAVAHYLPPIVERMGSRLVLLDGVHRMFITRQVGVTIEAIVVDGVTVPFPAEVHGWDQVHVVDAKPPRDERFHNLRPELFRDLKYVGVDG